MIGRTVGSIKVLVGVVLRAFEVKTFSTIIDDLDGTLGEGARENLHVNAIVTIEIL